MFKNIAHNFSLILINLACLILISCSSGGPPTNEKFTNLINGHWYGEEKNKDIQTYWIYHYKADKTFTLKTLEVDQGERRITEVWGTWFYKEGVFTETVTHNKIGKTAALPSKYQVDAISNQQFKYTEFTTKNQYMDKRVSAEFNFPQSKVVSIPTVKPRKKRRKKRRRKRVRGRGNIYKPPKRRVNRQKQPLPGPPPSRKTPALIQNK